MGARQSLESRRAMELVAGGMAVYKAAAQTGIDASTIYKRLKTRKKKRAKK